MEKNLPKNQFLRPKIGWELGNIVYHKRMLQILEFLSFCKIMANLPRKNRVLEIFAIFSR